MTMQASGTISFSQIRTEHAPAAGAISLGQCYRSGSEWNGSPYYVSQNNTSVPTSGAISFSQFYSTQRRRIGTRNYSTGMADQNAFSLFGSYTDVPCDATLSFNSGMSLYATSTGSPALTTGSGWVSSSTLTIVNNGYIRAKGGDGGAGGTPGGNGAGGGPAITLVSGIASVTIDNTNGYIYGGGGGGGGGGSWANATLYVGGGGGGGGCGNAYSNSSGGAAGYDSYSNTTWPAAGGAGGASAGAGGAGGNYTIGGEGACFQYGGAGGNGGAEGAAGGAGVSISYPTYGTCYTVYYYGGGSGGGAGNAIILNGVTLYWSGGNNGTQVKGAVS